MGHIKEPDGVDFIIKGKPLRSSKTGYRKYKTLILKHQNGLGIKHSEKGC